MKIAKKQYNVKKFSPAFTIVELLVVIVVIGILAAITIVSYSGISTRAKIASLQSDLVNSSKLLKMYYVDYGYYPTTISTDCAVSPTSSTNLCLKASSGNNYSDTAYESLTSNSFTLTATNGILKYHITQDSLPTEGIFVDPNYMVVGSQIWAKVSVNAGVMVSSAVAQTNNSILEKYCPNDLEANCTTYGALYQWDEAMQYVTSEGAQGICPAGSHIPTDNEWKILEVQKGMSQATADASDWRGTDQGTQLKVGGVSGLNMLHAGFRHTGGYSTDLDSSATLWSSTQSGANAWDRGLNAIIPNINRSAHSKSYGFSVRCVRN